MANVPKKFRSGVEITGTATVDSDEIATLTAIQTIQNKTIDNTNTIDVGALPSNIPATNIADGSVDNTEFQFLNGVTSSIQNQLDDKVNSADLASNANGLGASLVGIEDVGGLITATDVEGALAENRGVADSAQADATQALADAAAAQQDIDDHIADTVDAHDASAISYDNGTSGLSATEVQAAIDEVQSNVASSQAGINMKDAVRVATTAALAIATDLEAGDSVDGVTLVAGDRVLVKNQADPVENGIYVASASGAASRSADFDGNPSGEVKGGNLVYVQEGTTNANTQFILQGNADDKVVDTDPLNFTIFSRAEALVAGDGLDKTGLTLSVDASDIAGAGLQEDGANNLRIADSAAGTGIQLNSGVLSLDFTEFDTDDITEGAVNFYYTEGRFDSSFAGKDTDDLSEGATNLYFTDERAQDAVGTILTDSSKIDFTYDDGTPSITATIVAGSLVNADINAAAAIDVTKIHDGSVDNTEFGYLNGVTSPIQTQLDGKANQNLGNLTSPTAINQDLLPSAADTRNLGSSGSRWANFFGFSTRYYNLSSDLIGEVVPVSGDLTMRTPTGAPNSNDIDIVTGLGAGTGSVNLTTGNASSGDSGGIFLITGSASGSRGAIVLGGSFINASTSQVKNVVDPTDDQDAATKIYVDTAVSGIPTGSAGDIDETTFAMSNNQVAAADVTGLAFANATVRSFEALVSVEIDATADLFEVFTLRGIQKGSDWDMSVSSTGDNSNVNFTITSAGQIQYTSGNEAGFVSGDIKFRAITTTV